MKKNVLKYLLVLLFLCFVTWLVWNRFDYPRTGIDDANIFFVYAKHFAHGYGFVYNIGGERVEGFTSLLWVLICAIVFRLSNQPELTLLIINVGLVALGATITLSCIQSTITNTVYDSRKKILWSLFFLFLLFSSPSYIAWNTITLMENALWGILLLLATTFVIRKNISLPMMYLVFTPLSALLLLTRPEAFLWGPLFATILFARKAQEHGAIPALKKMMPLFLIILVEAAGLTLFRIVYFGYPLPNTYYAKVSTSLVYNLTRGGSYFIEYLVSDPVVLVCILSVILTGIHTILVFTKKKTLSGGLPFLPIIAGIGLLIPIITGGDHFGSFRFYQSIYPILLLCMFYCIEFVLPFYIKPTGNFFRSHWVPRSLALLSVLSLVLAQIQTWKSFSTISNMSQEFRIAQNGRMQGQVLTDLFEHLNKWPSVGVVIAGGVKYTYPGDVVDLMGLNNLLMAHNGGSRVGLKNHAAFEKTTFYQLEPDIVAPEVASAAWKYNAESLKNSWQNMVPLKGLYNDDMFLESYTYAKVARKDSTAGRFLVAWFKKDFLNTLDASGYFTVESYEYTAPSNEP